MGDRKAMGSMVRETGGVSMVVVMIAVVVVMLGIDTTAAAADTTIHPHMNIKTPNLLENLTLLYEDTYLLFGKGRRSSRDLPECKADEAAEACNLIHKRFWTTPIAERLCRCPNPYECPLQYTSLNDTLSQHVTNRAQLKFCRPITEKGLPVCKDGDTALSVNVTDVKKRGYESVTEEKRHTRTVLACRCLWPNYWKHLKTVYKSDTESLSTYTCNELPKCRSGDMCGFIRNDTLESYYTCSCPQQHLCIFLGPQTLKMASWLHFHGLAYTATCIYN